jgi:type IV secretory pathway VirB4 component
VTVVQGTKVFNNATPAVVAAAPGAKEGKEPPVRVANAPQAGSRIDGAEQRSRDSDSKAIFESELRKAESKQTELLKEYNNGEPEKRGGEAQNHQKYLDRVAEMKASIARNDSDIASIKRELGRASSSASR